MVANQHTPVLRAGSGVVSVSNPELSPPLVSQGFSYDSPYSTTKVTFNRDGSGCACIATTGAPDEVPARTVQQQHTGTVFVQPQWQPDFQGGVTKDPTSILVTVRAAAASDLLGFHLALFC